MKVCTFASIYFIVATLQLFAQNSSVREVIETVIGSTVYDLQSNKGMQDRIAVSSDGKIGAVFNLGTPSSNFADRGTGYNFYNGSSWNEMPSNRIETFKTGWPSYAMLGNGNEIVVSHQTSNASLVFMSREFGTTEDWEVSKISSSTGFIIAWNKLAVGGPDNNTIHCIALTYRELNTNDSVFQGQRQALLYWRSLDGGATWDIRDKLIVELDKTYFYGFRPDSYSLSSSGNNVAIGVWGPWYDGVILKSEDNGSSWKKSTVRDFPIDLYNYSSITDDDGDGLADTILTIDGCGDITFDSNGNLHAVFGLYKVIAKESETGSIDHINYHGPGEIHYWNESFKADSSIRVTGIVDTDNSGSINLISPKPAIGKYGIGYCSWPSIRMDADNNLFVVYSGVVENRHNMSQHFRHIYLTKSSDNGQTWCKRPNDLTPDNGEEGYECAFPSVARGLIKDKIHILYQRDFEPGIHLLGDKDPAEKNSIVYLQAGLSDTCWYEGVNIETLSDLDEIKVYPNPVERELYMQVGKLQIYDPQYVITNLLGERVLLEEMIYKNGKLMADCSSLESGIYIIHLSIDGITMSKRFVVSHN